MINRVHSLRLMHSARLLALLVLSVSGLVACGVQRAPDAVDIRPSEAAPELRLPLVGGGELDLATTLSAGPALVVFYRGYW